MTIFKKSANLILTAVLAVTLLPIAQAGAQTEASSTPQNSGLTLSVNPPLVQISMSPGERWASNLRITNDSPTTVTVYINAVNFIPTGDEGSASFQPVLDPNSNLNENSLAQWIEVSKQPIAIPAGKFADLSYDLNIPKTAPPGGHYGAILIGTEPQKQSTSGASVSTLLSTAFFLKVQGDVRELGDVREFRADKTFYTNPQVNFILRFENRGNVHLLPSGDITIYNMFGKVRGSVDLNSNGPVSLGAVLPQTIRRFNFAWKGSDSFFELGRYTAVTHLRYGVDNPAVATSVATFWVIPAISTIIFLAALLAFIVAAVFLIRLYIKRVLVRTSAGQGTGHTAGQNPKIRPSIIRLVREHRMVSAILGLSLILLLIFSIFLLRVHVGSRTIIHKPDGTALELSGN